jgi:hypothetical protein
MAIGKKRCRAGELLMRLSKLTICGQNNIWFHEYVSEIVKPRHRSYSILSSLEPIQIFFHSCAQSEVIGDLIIRWHLNPVQVSAVGMDSAELKKGIWRDLTFWAAPSIPAGAGDRFGAGCKDDVLAPFDIWHRRRFCLCAVLIFRRMFPGKYCRNVGHAARIWHLFVVEAMRSVGRPPVAPTWPVPILPNRILRIYYKTDSIPSTSILHYCIYFNIELSFHLKDNPIFYLRCIPYYIEWIFHSYNIFCKWSKNALLRIQDLTFSHPKSPFHPLKDTIIPSARISSRW